MAVAGFLILEVEMSTRRHGARTCRAVGKMESSPRLDLPGKPLIPMMSPRLAEFIKRWKDARSRPADSKLRASHMTWILAPSLLGNQAKVCAGDTDCQDTVFPGTWGCNSGSCQCAGVVCPDSASNAGSCVLDASFCIVPSTGKCTSQGQLCEPASGGIIKVCGSNNNCVSCSGTNPCPGTKVGNSGDSNYFKCTSGGCTRSCFQPADCFPMGLLCYTNGCDLRRTNK